MKHRYFWTKCLSLLLALTLCCSVLTPMIAEATDTTEATRTEDVEYDGAAFGTWRFSGSATADTVEAWTNSAISESSMRTLLNSLELYPQKTGWDQLDALIESMLAPYSDSDTYTKLRAMYDWLVKNVTYSWEGYSNTNASLASYNSFSLDYLSSMTYEDGLEKSIPDDMANRAYHILKYKKGVCYDYAIAFAVIARYIGIDAYVHTGSFSFETSSGSGHHGWAVLDLDGSMYVFDPQRDARNYEYNGKNGYYFGIPSATALSTRYNPSTNASANTARDASMLSVKADRAHKVTVAAQISGNGSVSGTGSYITGNTATLTATAASGNIFSGWYDASGNLLSTNTTYTFTVTDAVTITAKFLRRYTVTAVASRSGSVSGAGTVTAGETLTLTADSTSAPFVGWYDVYGNLLGSDASYTLTPSDDVTIYALFEGDVFCDIPLDAWYLDDVMTAYEMGLIKGITDVSFEPETVFTRAMVVTVLARLENADTAAAAAAPFTDVDQSAWYAEAVNWAYENNLVKGRSETIFDPDAAVTREEYCLMIVRYLEQKGYTAEAIDLSDVYVDADDISYDEAYEAVAKATVLGLVQGDPSKTVRPTDSVIRSEGVTILVRTVRVLETPPEDPDTQPEEDTDTDPDAGTDTDEDTDPDTDGGSGSDPDPDPDTDGDSGSDPDPDTDGDTDAGADAVPESDSDF